MEVVEPLDEQLVETLAVITRRAEQLESEYDFNRRLLLQLHEELQVLTASSG